MRYNEILNLSEIIGEGFFADRVVNLLGQRQLLGVSEEELLRQVLSFLEKAKKGERQVESGRLASDALDSIGAYHRAIRTIALQSIQNGIERPMRKAFKDILGAMESEVEAAIKEREISPEDLEITRSFFKLIKQQTLSEASKYYSRKVEVPTWPSLLC